MLSLLYGTTISLSAFLLFEVQPMVGKMLLPWFGDTVAVWSTCLLFFQVVLLLGYLFAHGAARRAEHGMEAGRQRGSGPADPGADGGQHGLALFHALLDRAAGAGMVFPRTAGCAPIPAVCALHPGFHAGPA
jgi:hypothetical protein